MQQTDTLIKELIFLIEKGNAHVPFDKAINGIPPALRGAIPGKLPYSIWQLAEHIRITQWDILEFCLSEQHESPKWPEGYWPRHKATIDEGTWENTMTGIRRDRERFVALLREEGKDLFSPFPYGTGQNLLREALLIADHTSYHTGEILVARRLLGCWP